jgi:hypothetical protein
VNPERTDIVIKTTDNYICHSSLRVLKMPII